jgi:integrase/recombinase XerD
MDEAIRTAAISPLRQRLIDDMNMRRFSRETQRNYTRDVGRFCDIPRAFTRYNDGG